MSIKVIIDVLICWLVSLILDLILWRVFLTLGLKYWKLRTQISTHWTLKNISIIRLGAFWTVPFLLQRRRFRIFLRRSRLRIFLWRNRLKILFRWSSLKIFHKNSRLCLSLLRFFNDCLILNHLNLRLRKSILVILRRDLFWFSLNGKLRQFKLYFGCSVRRLHLFCCILLIFYI